MKKAAYHVVKKPPELVQRAKNITRFPHIWICVIILSASVIALLISSCLNRRGNSFWSSIFANIFAGLITGFVVCLINGMKQITIIKMREKKAWLENLASMLKQYFSGYNQLLRMHFEKFDGNEEKYNFIYNVGSHANWINEEILQSSFSKILPFKAIKYSKESLRYDAPAMCDAFDRLHGNLQALDVECPSSKELIKYFDEVNPALRGLNSEVYTAIRELDIRLSGIQKTIV